MKRFHSAGDQKAVRKRLEDIKCTEFFPEKYAAAGRLRKKHPFDCGSPHCPCCNSKKWTKPGRDTVSKEIKKEFHEI